MADKRFDCYLILFLNSKEYAIILYASFATKKLQESNPFIGESSFISAPIIWEDCAAIFIILIASSQNKPPGSGVPVAGIMLESSPSTSNVR